MKLLNIAFCLLMAGGVLTVPAGGADSSIETDVAPPPARTEVPSLSRGYLWARGYWRWEGKRYVWVTCHTLKERAGYSWVDAHWLNRGGRYHFVPGQWVKR